MSQLDPHTKTIDGDTYKVLMLDPMVSADLLLDLSTIFGPSLSIMGSGLLKARNSKEALQQLMEGVGGTEDLVGMNLEKAISSLIERLSKEKQREIVGVLSGVTSVQKDDAWPSLESIFSIHFRGRLKAMYKWLAFALQVQFKDFFSTK